MGLVEGSEEVIFKVKDGVEFRMYHQQDCCENVSVEDVCGDVGDLIGAEVLHFEERTDEAETDWGHTTWTFYDIQTTKGCVNIRWCGESNGYYSESVYIEYL